MTRRMSGIRVNLTPKMRQGLRNDTPNLQNTTPKAPKSRPSKSQNACHAIHAKDLDLLQVCLLILSRRVCFLKGQKPLMARTENTVIRDATLAPYCSSAFALGKSKAAPRQHTNLDVRITRASPFARAM